MTKRASRLHQGGTAIAASQISEDKVTKWTHTAVVSYVLFSLVALIVWFITDNRPASTSIHFNGYGILSELSFLSNLIAFILIIRVRPWTDSIMWFAGFLLSLASWAGAEVMARVAATPAGAILWSRLTTLGSVTMPVFLYMFALSYTKSRRAKQPFLLPLLSGVATLLLFIDANSDILSNYHTQALTPTSWGYDTATGPGYFLLALWTVLLSTAAYIMLARFRKQTMDPQIRRQTKLFMVAIAIPLVVGTVTDGLLPALNNPVVPPMSVMLLTIMGVIISYGILRDDFFTFTPNTVADQILDTMNEAVIGMQEDFSLSYANTGAERLLGYPAHELTQRRFREYLAKSVPVAQLRRDITDHLRHKPYYTVDEVDFMTKEGDIITTKMSISRVLVEGKPRGYLVVLTDITALTQTQAIIERQVTEQTKKIRETRSTLISSINSLEFGFVLVDSTPSITMVNDEAHELFCGNTDHASADCKLISVDYIQQALGAKVPLSESIARCLETIQTQDIRSVDYINNRTLRIFISPVVDGDTIIGAAILFQDITEEQILARSRDEFFSIASHELRTPLTAIKGNSSMIQTYYADILKDPTLAELVADIHESSDRLIAIVNDFLDMSRLEQGRLTYVLAAVNVHEIVEKIMYELGANSKERGIYLRLGKGMKTPDKVPAVIADYNRLKQVLYNLIGNSLKFTDKGGITIDANIVDGNLHITVKDTGRGIDSKMQSLLFHKFQQANESLLTRDTSRGTGLGLYISRLLTEGMGGSLELTKSVPGKGSTFTINLPLATKQSLRALPTGSGSTVDTASGLTVAKSTASGK